MQSSLQPSPHLPECRRTASSGRHRTRQVVLDLFNPDALYPWYAGRHGTAQGVDDASDALHGPRRGTRPCRSAGLHVRSTCNACIASVLTHVRANFYRSPSDIVLLYEGASWRLTNVCMALARPSLSHVHALSFSGDCVIHVSCMHAYRQRKKKKQYVRFHGASFSAIQRASMTREAEQWLT